MLPPDWVTVAHRDSEVHDRLCDAVLDDHGYILVNDELFEIITWKPVKDASWAWTLRRVSGAGRA